MTTHDVAFRFLSVIEGLKLEAYLDIRGIWTIGFGHTLGVKKGDKITYEQALGLFRADVAPLYAVVSKLPIIQAGMLVSFGYNCGISPLKKVVNKEYKVTPDGFIQSNGKPYGVTSGGKYSPALDNRRKLEAGLLLAAGFSS